MKLNEIHNIDCIKGMKKMDENSIHLIFTSPPYFNARDYSTWETYNDYLIFLKEVFTEAYRILDNGRMCVVNISPIIVPRKSRNDESKRLNLPMHLCSLMEEIGFKFLEDIHWIKPEGSAKNRNGGFYQNRNPVSYKPNIVNEYIFVFQKQMDGLIDKIIKSYDDEIKEKSKVLGNYERSNVWFINPETNSKHPAPFPKELSNKVISYYSYINDNVLDMFSGSGTTAISCIENNRNYIGFEIHKEYIDIFNNRKQNIGNLNDFF